MLNEVILREHIYQKVIKIGSAKDLFDLFEILGYPENIILDPSSKRKKSDFDFRKEDEERIKEIYSILSFKKDLPVFLLETTTLHPSFVRSVASAFDKQYPPFLLIFTTDYSEISFVFPDKEKKEAGKHKLKLTKLTIDKEDIKSKKDYYSVIQTLANMEYEDKAGWREVWRKWKKAFSVERVTEEFFDRVYDANKLVLEDIERMYKEMELSHTQDSQLKELNRSKSTKFIKKMIDEIELQITDYLYEYPNDTSAEHVWEPIKTKLLSLPPTKKRLQELRRIWRNYVKSNDWKKMIAELGEFLTEKGIFKKTVVEPFDMSKLRLIAMDFIS